MKKLTLKNYFFVGNPQTKSISLVEWLVKQMLHGKASRARTRFLQLINDRYKEVDETRVELLKKYAKRDKDDKVIMLYDKPVINKKTQQIEKIETLETTDPKIGKRYDMDKDNLEKFNKEYTDYLNEEYIVDVTPATRDHIYGVREILLDTVEEFSERMAVLYDEWCDAFENIQEEKDESKKEEKKGEDKTEETKDDEDNKEEEKK